VNVWDFKKLIQEVNLEDINSSRMPVVRWVINFSSIVIQV
jgi:hypothetical protein